MANFYRDNNDIRFYLDSAVDWPPLVEAVELNYHAVDAPGGWQEAVDGYREMLDLVGQFVGEQVAPRARLIDQQGVHLQPDGTVKSGEAQAAIFEQLKELGIYGLAVPRNLGGLNSPMLPYFLAVEMFSRADPSTMAHFGFHAGIAAALSRYALDDPQTELDEHGNIVHTAFEPAIREIVAGKAWGSMDLTESEAGSDLAAIRARAVKDKDGTWRLTGNKIFITSGHGKYHLVLAKTEERYSLDALSLFLVPATIERDGKIVRNAWVDRVEDKIGQHGSATCSVQFEGSQAKLIGNTGEGFKLMLLLMNNARIGVGFESIGTCETAYRLATSYAAERQSMGKVIAEHELIADYLDEMEVTILGLRALAITGAVAEEMGARLELIDRATGAHPSEERLRLIRRYKRQARQITPLIKYAASEAAVWATRMNMQIHGGNGYMKDYDAERLLRDALVMPIYEGTSQIQALMVLRDNLGFAIRNPQGFIRKLAAAKLDAVRSFDPLERAFHAVESLSYSAQQHILLKIAKDKLTEAMGAPLASFIETFRNHWDPKRDFAFGLLHAERLTQILADVNIARVLVDQAKRFPERRELAERWLERAEPRVRYNWEMIHHRGERVLQRLRQHAEAAASAEPGGTKSPAAAS